MTAPLTTAPMSWPGPGLDDEARDLLALIDDLAADRGTVLTDDPEVVAALVRELGELGVWTLGAAEEHGGGGSSRTTAIVAWERLGRYWPALGWASVQAHAALVALGGSQDELTAGLHAGTAAVAVVRADPTVGEVARVDAAHPAPYLLVIGDDRGVLLEPDDLAFEPLERTGLLGALTRSVSVSGSAAHEVLAEVDVDRALATLHLGAAAVAVGIAGAAADTALGYTRGRHQFGGPLYDLPTVRASVDDQRAWVRATLAAVLGADEHDATARAVLRRATDGAVDVAAAALQTHGGYGFLTEYPVERYLRDAVSLRAATHPVDPEAR